MTASSAEGSSIAGGARRTPAQTAALVIGAVFLLVGILGFIPGITSDFATLQFAGPDSQAKILGLFQVSILHNIVHLLFGVLGLAAARTHPASLGYLLYGGIIYLILFVYGLLVPADSGANFVPMNGADHVLHLALAVVMIGLGLALRRRGPVVGSVR